MDLKAMQAAVAAAAKKKQAEEAKKALAAQNASIKKAERDAQAQIDAEKRKIENEKAQRNKQEVAGQTAGANAAAARRIKANSLLSAYAEGEYDEQVESADDLDEEGNPYPKNQKVQLANKRKRATLFSSFGE